MKAFLFFIIAVMGLVAGAPSLRAQIASSPVSDLAQKLQTDPKEREEAGKRLADFLLKSDSTGKSFVSADADRRALGAVAQEWTRTADAGRLALLLFVSAPDTKAESRLRLLLAPWTGNAQIKKESGKTAVAAFLVDAENKAAMVLAERASRHEIDEAIQANDQTAVQVPGARESLERARELRERQSGASAGVFGPDREIVDLNDLPAQNARGSASDLARKLQGDPKQREEAGKRLEAFLLTPDSVGRSFASGGIDQAALGAVAREWARAVDADRLALLLLASAPESKTEPRLRAALSSWAGKNQIDKTHEKAQLTAFLNDAAAKAGEVLADSRARREIDEAIQANDQALPAVSLPLSLRNRKMFDVPPPDPR